MKKIVSLILISVIMMALSVNVFATGVLGDDNTTTITGNQYEEAQKNTQNTENNDTTLPQTGVGDFGVGILLVVFAASAVFAFKKVSDYRDI